MERTYEYRLYPTLPQQRSFELTAITTRDLYNLMLKDRTEHFLQTGKWKKLDPEPFIKKSLLMRELDSTIITNTVGRLDTAYRNFFYIKNNKPDRYHPEALRRSKEDPDYKLLDTDLIGYPKFKSNSSKESWTIAADHVQLTEKHIAVPGMGKIKVKLHRPIPEDADIKGYTLLKKPSGHFYLLVHLELPEPKAKPDLEKALGVAFEPGKLIQCSEGFHPVFRAGNNALQNKIEQAYLKLCKMTPGSRRYEKQRKHLGKLYEKRVNQRRDSLHKISSCLVNKADFICIEEPKVMARKKALMKTGEYTLVHDEAWWTFSAYLKYKTFTEGKKFWRVPDMVPVRYACSICGLIAERPPKGSRWKCNLCGAEMPSSLNAARNLALMGKQYIETTKKENA